MCGLFGAIGKNPNLWIVRTLAILNESRGRDSLGFFNSRSQILKKAGDPHDLISHKKFWKILVKMSQDSWFIAGHTRAGTRGGRTDANAHPFRYKNILGSHNGVIQAPNHYDVDSMYIFDLLSQKGNDHVEALKDITGSMALTWYDGERLTMASSGNDIHWIDYEGVRYYSSSHNHILVALGHVGKAWKIKDHNVVSFTPKDEGPLYFVEKWLPEIPSRISQSLSHYSHRVGFSWEPSTNNPPHTPQTSLWQPRQDHNDEGASTWNRPWNDDTDWDVSTSYDYSSLRRYNSFLTGIGQPTVNLDEFNELVQRKRKPPVTFQQLGQNKDTSNTPPLSVKTKDGKVRMVRGKEMKIFKETEICKSFFTEYQDYKGERMSVAVTDRVSVFDFYLDSIVELVQLHGVDACEDLAAYLLLKYWKDADELGWCLEDLVECILEASLPGTDTQSLKT